MHALRDSVAYAPSVNRWETVDGGVRSWIGTGMPCVRPSVKVSKERNGRTCITSILRCTRRSAFSNRASVRKPKRSDTLGAEPQCDKRCVHMRSPTAALDEAMKRAKDGAGRAQSSTHRKSKRNGSNRRATAQLGRRRLFLCELSPCVLEHLVAV